MYVLHKQLSFLQAVSYGLQNAAVYDKILKRYSLQ